MQANPQLQSPQATIENKNKLKPTSAFRMKKQYKRLLANEVNNERRALLKQAFIQAQLQEELKVKTND